MAPKDKNIKFVRLSVEIGFDLPDSGTDRARYWSIWVYGSSHTLGAWDKAKARRLLPRSAFLWFTVLQVSELDENRSNWSYKYIIRNNKDLESTIWEGDTFEFRLQTPPSTSSFLLVKDKWKTPGEQSIAFQGVPEPREDEVIVTVGKALLPSGDPTEMLVGRMKKTAEVFSKNKANYLIVTGGLVLQNVRPEGEVMRELAIAEGIPSERIIVEPFARTTIENALFVREIIWEKGWQKLLVISSDFHVSRVKEIFQRVFPSFHIRSEADTPNLNPNQRKDEEDTEMKMMSRLNHQLLYYGDALDCQQ